MSAKGEFRDFSKYVRTILLVAIAMVSGFLIYELATNKPTPSINFGILNDQGKYGVLPSNVTAGEEFRMQYHILNHHPEISKFAVRTYQANYSVSTVTFAGGVDGGNFLGEFNHTLALGQSYTSGNISFSIPVAGDLYRICFELWVLNGSHWNYVENSVHYAWVNVTA